MDSIKMGAVLVLRVTPVMDLLLEDPKAGMGRGPWRITGVLSLLRVASELRVYGYSPCKKKFRLNSGREANRILRMDRSCICQCGGIPERSSRDPSGRHTSTNVVLSNARLVRTRISGPMPMVKLLRAPLQTFAARIVVELVRDSES